MKYRVWPTAVAILLSLFCAACGSDPVESLANAVPAEATVDVAANASDGSSTTDTSSPTSASSTSATSATNAVPETRDSTVDDPFDGDQTETGGSISITAEDIDAAAGWVDVSAKNYAPCDVIDDETYAVEVFNDGDETADYELSTVFYQADGSENEAAAGVEIIPSLRPGERSVQEGWSPFDGTGESCIVTTIRRAVTAGDAPEAEDRCTVVGITESGFVDFRVEVIGTHDGEVWPMVAFVDADSVRRATHQGLIKELAIGELGTVAEINISGVEDPTVVACAVVSRINF